MGGYLAALRNYVGFGGRARRREFWGFALVSAVVSVALQAGGWLVKSQIPVQVYEIAVLLPSLAVLFRRLHDAGRSAWWLLIGVIPLAGQIVLLVFLCTAGDRGDNRYGPDPKGPSDVADRRIRPAASAS